MTTLQKVCEGRLYILVKSVDQMKLLRRRKFIGSAQRAYMNVANVHQ
jgi:hypothetical protein